MTTIIKSVTSIFPSRKLLVSVLGFTFLACVFLYMYLLTMSVVHVVMRKEATQDLRMVESEIAELETEFMRAQHLVSRAIVDNQQYAQAKQKVFINRNTSAAVAVFAQ